MRAADLGLTGKIRKRQKGGRLARGRQKGKLWMGNSTVNVLMLSGGRSDYLWSDIYWCIYRWPCASLGQCVSAHIVPLLYGHTLWL